MTKIDTKNEYKISGCGWFGSAPAGWEINKIAAVFDFRNTKVSDEDFEPLSVTYDGIKKQIESAAKTDNSENRKLVKIGDIVINGRSDRRGAVGISKYDGSVSGVYHVLKSKRNIETEYFHHLFRNSLFSQEFFKWGRGIHDDLWTTRSVEMGHIIIPIPPLKIQKRIANFLDEKAKTIDGLIEKKEKLIELLRDKRAALITRAVTKGLNPKAKMRPSGVDWLGDIPAGWEVKRIRFLSHINASNIDKKSYEGEKQVLLCNYVDVYKNEFIVALLPFMSATATDEQTKKFGLKIGDIIITKDSEIPNDIGIPAYVKDKVNGLVCGYHLYHIRTLKIDAKYLFRFLQSKVVQGYFETRANGVIRFGLGSHAVKNLSVPIPSLKEQEQIANYLDNETAKTDKAAALIESQIEKLKEYRSSLIYHAVTGKMKI